MTRPHESETESEDGPIAGEAALIGLDWGTSALRAFLLDAHGTVLATRERPWGVRFLPEGGYPQAFEAVTAGWPRRCSVASGMVGSSLGWREAPYVALPADARQLAGSLVSVHTASGARIHIVPGLHTASGPDVLRGEETQLAGGLVREAGLAPGSTWVLPGTHSKWVRVRDGEIVDFQTAMTGELFDVLIRHSILGAGLPARDHSASGGSESEASEAADAFLQGVCAARDSAGQGGFSRLFTVRALRLEGQLAQTAVADYLSGLLVGEELRAMLASGRFDCSHAIQLIGARALCQRYQQAGRCFGLEMAYRTTPDAATGLWEIGRLAGLLDTAPAGAS